MRLEKHFKFVQHMTAAMTDDDAFESEDVARFVSFLMNYLEVDQTEDMYEWLRKCEPCVRSNPVLLAKLQEEHDCFRMECSDVLRFLDGGRNFLNDFEDAIEQGLIDIKDEASIDALTIDIQTELSHLLNDTVTDLARYFRIIGCYCGSKKQLGKYFDNYRLVADWKLKDGDESNGFQVIYETIKGEFFLDLTGGLDNFLRGFVEDGGPQYADELEQYLYGRGLNEDGEVVDSDADSQGNLKDFVEDDEEDDGDGEEEGSEDDGEDGDQDDEGSEDVDDSDAAEETEPASKKRKIKTED